MSKGWQKIAERQNILRCKLDKCKKLRTKFNSELDTEEHEAKLELKVLNAEWDKRYTG